MKNLLTLIITCTIASIIFSSCKQGLSIMKRHYTDGYYVSHSGKKQNPVPQEKKETRTISKAKLPEYALKDVKEENQVSPSEKQMEKNADENLLASNENIKAQKNKIQKQNQNNASNFKPEKKPTRLNGVPDIKKMVSSDEREGLSLFWIIILVILLLWALGFGLGLGEIIHVLLIIALVLLILWLLRIV